ncbi:helix-turn-helix transcriptional regulator [Mesobacillus foraminis]|uniref:helix-turn-helix domain-containing protein n=1 Tax=Mesobacillus foraminis TaxID=279826 RepID=UPI00399F8794
MSNFGELVRSYREKKGYTLTDFAKRIGVSAGYLSNLETGKTQKIHLNVLDKFQQELGIHPLQSENQRLEQRFHRISLLVQQCNKRDPSFTEHFIKQLEQSLELLNEA